MPLERFQSVRQATLTADEQDTHAVKLLRDCCGRMRTWAIVCHAGGSCSCMINVTGVSAIAGHGTGDTIKDAVLRAMKSAGMLPDGGDHAEG